LPSWNELLTQFDSLSQANGTAWVRSEIEKTLQRIAALRGHNVLLYGSAFLQKPQAPQLSTSITFEDLNGLMSVLYGMDWSKGLTLILHTPGGVTNAAETLVSYLRSKFQYFEVAVPTFAMSAGTMISLAADRIIMGRQSQLGPIDPQFSSGNRAVSARAVVDLFRVAKDDILSNVKAAHAWAPILQAMGPSLLQEAQNALDYGEKMVETWLKTWMLANQPDADIKAASIAKHFNDASHHKSHGRRIDRADARAQGVVIEDLEDNQDLQDAVLTAYHLFTIIVEKSLAAKLFVTDAGRMYVKNWSDQQLLQVVPTVAPKQSPP
jgi:hypothetical protein